MTSKFSAFLFILIPPSLVTGPFIPDLIISILGIFFLIESIRNKLWDYYKHPFVSFFLIFYLYLIIVSITSVDTLLSLESSLFYFRFLFFGLSVFFLLKTYKSLLFLFGLSLLASVFFVSIDALIQYFFKVNIIGFIPVEQFRISGMFADELILGSYISRMIPFIALFYITFSNKDKKIYFWPMVFILILFSFVIVISGERSALFIFLLTNLSFIFFSKGLKKIFIISFIISTSLFLSALQFDLINHRFSKLAFKQLEISKEVNQSTNLDNTISKYIPPNKINIFDIKSYVLTSTHQSIYITAIKMFLDRPFFGNGPKTFRILCNTDKYIGYFNCSTHPHNSYVQLLAETGIFGFLGLMLFFLYNLKFLFKNFLNLYFFKSNNLLNDRNVCMHIAIMISTWPLMPTGSFFNNWLNVIYFLPMGILLYCYRNYK